LLRDIELGGERNRGIYVLKARGTAHSNQIREFLLSSKGIDIQDVYIGPEGVLTGSMRIAQEAKTRQNQEVKSQESERKRRELDSKRKILEARILALEAEFETDAHETQALLDNDRVNEELRVSNEKEMRTSRKGDIVNNKKRSAKK